MQKIIHQLGKHKIKGEGFNGRREGEAKPAGTQFWPRSLVTWGWCLGLAKTRRKIQKVKMQITPAMIYIYMTLRCCLVQEESKVPA